MPSFLMIVWYRDMSSFCTGIDLIVSGGLEIGYGTKQPYPDFFGKPSET